MYIYIYICIYICIIYILHRSINHQLTGVWALFLWTVDILQGMQTWAKFQAYGFLFSWFSCPHSNWISLLTPSEHDSDFWLDVFGIICISVYLRRNVTTTISWWCITCITSWDAAGMKWMASIPCILNISCVLQWSWHLGSVGIAGTAAMNTWIIIWLWDGINRR